MKALRNQKQRSSVASSHTSLNTENTDCSVGLFTFAGIPHPLTLREFKVLIIVLCTILFNKEMCNLF